MATEGSRLTRIWYGHGTPDKPQKGGQIVGTGGVWLQVDGVWYQNPYRSKYEAVRAFEEDEEAAVKEVLDQQKQLSESGA